jgi:hypothetical protein
MHRAPAESHGLQWRFTPVAAGAFPTCKRPRYRYRYRRHYRPSALGYGQPS